MPLGSRDESLAGLRGDVLDTGCNNTCYTESGLPGLFNRSAGAPIQGALWYLQTTECSSFMGAPQVYASLMRSVTLDIDILVLQSG